MNSIMLVFLGGGLGSVVRYLAGLSFSKSINTFPYQTFLVNVIGSLLIGLLLGYFNTQESTSPQWKLLLVTGFCGGFTTFSTFSFETISLIKTNQIGTAFLYVMLSLIIGIVATYIGYLLFELKK
jgi:CrcB protein